MSDEQGDLFRSSIQARFNAWARENPKIIELFLRFAREVKASGRQRYGIAAITERVRWHMAVETKGDEFKLNNNWRAPMARLLVQLDPRLEGLFEMRERKS